MSIKRVCLCQRDYIFNCNENDNGKIYHINKNQAGLDADMETNIQNIACLGKAMPPCNKQHLCNIWGLVHQKVKQYWG